MTVLNRFLLTAFSLGLLIQSSLAAVTLPSIISDHMVLQKSDNVPIWGKADPGEEVKVTFNGKTETVKAGEDGAWKVTLNLKEAAAGPSEMIVEGKNRIAIADVLVGEVWLASGQSNMEWSLRQAGGAEQEIPASANNLLRQFTVTNKTSLTPADSCVGTWIIASPETSGNFSAVGYFFGKALQKELKVPVGIIDSTWGGTPVEAWTSGKALDKVAFLKEAKDRNVAEFVSFPERKENFLKEFSAWLSKVGRENTPPANPSTFAAPDVSTTDWTPVTLPGKIQGKGLPELGVFWVRQPVTLKPDSAGKDLTVEIDGGTRNLFESVYWNGEKIGELNFSDFEGEGQRRGYKVPGNLVKETGNVLAIRAFSPVGNPNLAIRVAGVPANGEWLAKVEKEFSPLAKDAAPAPEILKGKPAPHGSPSQLFNAMINPIVPYAIQGAIWYQGESNAGRAWQYRQAFPLLISDWRELWDRGNFPFYFCQLANYMKKTDVPQESNWAELREAQSMTLKLPKTGQAILIDIGEDEDIHPRKKKEAADRLALIALANEYGKDVSYSGPVYDSMKIEGDKVRVSFKEASGGLVAKELPKTYPPKTGAPEVPLVLPSPDSDVQGFAICGEDQKWVWANAKIDGSDVVVWSEAVPKPIAVRYAWANNPTCNLYNGKDLPASPFRSDDFPITTQPK